MSDTKKQLKKLYVFAHRGEAQAWLDKYNFNKIPFVFDGLWTCEDSFLLICQEGIQNATENLSIFLALHAEQVSEIFNYGIVGKLDQKLTIGKIYPVRYVYHFANNEAQYKSFQLSSEGIDCISTYERINQKEKAIILNHFAHVVDRELWAICRVAHIFKLKVNAYKIISDDSGYSHKIDCQVIQKMASFFSHELYLYDQKYLLTMHSSIFTEYQLPETYRQHFYFTHSMNQQFQSIMNKLVQKHKSTEGFYFEEYIEKIIQMKMKPKDRTLLLIEWLNEILNPFKSMLKNKLAEITNSYEERNIKVLFAKDHENTELTFELKVNSEENLRLQIEALQLFPVRKIQEILNGEIDV